MQGNGVIDHDGVFVAYEPGPVVVTATLGNRSASTVVDVEERDVRRPVTVVGRLPRTEFTTAEVWMWAGPRANRFVDVTGVMDRKMAALRCHASQLEDPVATCRWVQEWLAGTGRQAGLPEGRLAEAFHVVDTT
jgi:LmbE family N-acetylglucosaminyl deacetylase